MLSAPGEEDGMVFADRDGDCGPCIRRAVFNLKGHHHKQRNTHPNSNSSNTRLSNLLLTSNQRNIVIMHFLHIFAASLAVAPTALAQFAGYYKIISTIPDATKLLTFNNDTKKVTSQE